MRNLNTKTTDTITKNINLTIISDTKPAWDIDADDCAEKLDVIPCAENAVAEAWKAVAEAEAMSTTTDEVSAWYIDLAIALVDRAIAMAEAEGAWQDDAAEVQWLLIDLLERRAA